jgi:hypothetical protein
MCVCVYVCVCVCVRTALRHLHPINFYFCLIYHAPRQVNGLLDLTERTAGGDKKYQALEEWAGTLDALSKNLPQPVSGTSSAFY